MVSTSISVVNKMKNLDTYSLIADIFKANWKDQFLFDTSGNRVLTYEEFFSSVLNCRAILKDLGLKKNDFVCLLMPNSLDLMVLYFASLTMQLKVVPIDPYKGETDIKEILSAANCKIVIYGERIDCAFDGVDITKIRDEFYKCGSTDTHKLDVFAGIDYEQLFLITFTSGSTGVSKGVMHSFNNLVLSGLAFKEKFNFGKGNIFYHNLPMTYMAGILNLIILPFVSESKIVIGERFNISNIMRFWDAPIKYSVNTFWFIPTIIAMLLKLDRGTCGIEYVKNREIVGCVGTAALNLQVKQVFHKRYNIPLYESYGLCETLFVTTNYPGRVGDENGVGSVLGSVDLAFSQDNEILIGVPWMFLGYLNVGTEGCFENGKFRSGDLGTTDEQGSLVITGRKKDLIIRGGINISPKKIEDFISTFNIFEESTIVGVEEINLGEKTVCFFVPDSNSFSEDVKKELNTAIIKKLGNDYKIDEFVRMEAIPKTTSGKVDKQRLKSSMMVKNR